jgi:hypothetical protein
MVMFPAVDPVETVMAAKAEFAFAIEPVKEIWVFPPVKLYPNPGVKPATLGIANVTPEGGFTNPIETFRVAEELNPLITKSPGSWPLVLNAKVGAEGAVIVGVSAAKLAEIAPGKAPERSAPTTRSPKPACRTKGLGEGIRTIKC